MIEGIGPLMNRRLADYTVGGAVSGLYGTLVIQNHNGDDVTITTSDGTFTFPTSSSRGGNHSVSIRNNVKPPFGLSRSA